PASEMPHIWMNCLHPTSKPSNMMSSYVGMSGASGNFYIATGSENNNSSGVIDFYSSRINNNGDQEPTFNGVSQLLLSLSATVNNNYRDLNMNQRDITNVGDITTFNYLNRHYSATQSGKTITASTPTLLDNYTYITGNLTNY